MVVVAAAAVRIVEVVVKEQMAIQAEGMLREFYQEPEANQGTNTGKGIAEEQNKQAHASLKNKGTEPVGEPASKKKKKFVLCCEICEGEHFTSQCPLLHGPKPMATFCGLAGDGLGFFHIPCTSAAKAPARKVSATDLIKIVEGNVPVCRIKSHRRGVEYGTSFASSRENRKP
jgi:hypothetical protein